ncbi:hypothetical protein MTO96_029121 [Rhipicephalus appendiculatus]
MMHSLGVRTIEEEAWATKDFLGNYTERVLCLRRSHKSVLSLSRLQETLDDTLDSENLADLVGTNIAYTAFTSLMPQDVAQTLPGLDVSPEQLFFVINCAKWCNQYSIPTKRYAPFRSRCIVPPDEHGRIRERLWLPSRGTHESVREVLFLVVNIILPSLFLSSS